MSEPTGRLTTVNQNRNLPESTGPAAAPRPASGVGSVAGGRSVPQAQLARVLESQLASWQQRTGRREAAIVDVGGGTGGMATHLAASGHTLTVIDPSPDALASLSRRAIEAEVADRVTGRQGDAGDVSSLMGESSVDVVLCHRVLDVVDQPGEALTSMAAALRPDGLISLLVPGRRAAALGHAINGQIEAADQAMDDPRRFDLDQIVALFDAAGLELVAEHGIAALADLVPESAVESSAARQRLLELEVRLSTDPVFRALAAHLHVTGRPRP